MTSKKWMWSGLAFGVVLCLFGLACAGGGHGSYLPFAVFGAPVGILVPVLPVLVWWQFIGLLLDRGKGQIVLILLAVHTMSVATILITGTPMEPGSEQWDYLGKILRFNPEVVWTGFAIYVVGLSIAWRVAASQHLHGPRRARV